MPAPASLTFGWEPLARVFAEPNWGDLIREHWEECGVHKEAVPLDPDYERCLLLEGAGVYRGWVARADNRLVGYVGWFIQPMLHYRSTLHGIDDLHLLAPAYRRGDNAARFIEAAKIELKALGVARVIMHNKIDWADDRPNGREVYRRFMRRLGFEETDTIWACLL